MDPVSVAEINQLAMENERLKEALRAIRTNMRSIEQPNEEADSYIDDTLEIIEDVLGE